MYQTLCWTNLYEINEITLLIQLSWKERFFSCCTCCGLPLPAPEILSLLIPPPASQNSLSGNHIQLPSVKASHCPHVGAEKDLGHTGYHASSFNSVLLFSGVSWKSIVMHILIKCLDRNAFQTSFDGSFALKILRCDLLS